jgi:hypothetical protein
MHNMEIRNLEDEVSDVTCHHGTMSPRSMRYQFRPGSKMADVA